MLLCAAWLVLFRIHIKVSSVKTWQKNLQPVQSYTQRVWTTIFLAAMLNSLPTLNKRQKISATSPASMWIPASSVYAALKSERRSAKTEKTKTIFSLVSRCPRYSLLLRTKIFLDKWKAHYKEHTFKQTQKHTLYASSPIFSFFYLGEKIYFLDIYLTYSCTKAIPSICFTYLL